MISNTKFIKKDSLHQINSVLEDDFDSDSDNGFNDDTNPLPEIKYVNKVHSVIINSVDRDWTNTDDTPFNFRVKFSPESERQIQYPLYENNETIPATITQAKAGERGSSNTSGWYDSGGTFRLAYNASLPPGDQVDYEYITIKDNYYAPISTTYRNIVSVKLVSAVLPNNKRTLEYTTSYNYMSDLQYINVNIDELEHTQEGTNTQLRKSFVVLYPKVKISTSTPPFIDYYNINEWESKINVNTLPMLTIQCYDPLNKLVSNKTDVLDIEYIYRYQSDSDDTQTELLAIRTTNYFDPNEFTTENKILIRNYEYRDSTSDYATAFNEFINREEGHYIINTGREVGKYLSHTIYIPKPAVLNNATGEIDDLAWYTMLKLEGFTDDVSTISSNETGKILNLNMQTSFFFHFTTTEPDNSIIQTQQMV